MEQNSAKKNMTPNNELYLTLLSTKERDLVKNILKLFESSNAGAVKQQQAPLVQYIHQRPYPLLQILHNERSSKSRYQIGRIIAEALQKFFTTAEKQNELDFISFLASFPADILDAKSLRNKLLDYLATKNINDETILALISRNDALLLDDVLGTMGERFWSVCNSSGLPCKEFVLKQALDNGKNFVVLLSASLKQFNSIENVALRHNLLILKILQEINDPTRPIKDIANIAKWLESFKINETPSDLREIHQFFHADFQRFCVILEFLRQHDGVHKSIGAVMQANGILQLLYECNIDSSFEETCSVIERLHKWQRKMPTTRSIRDLELETLAYYSSLSIVFDIILADDKLGILLEPFYASKLQQLNSVMRQVRNFDVLCALLEDIFQLVFLRWEQLEKNRYETATSQQRNKSTRSSSYTDSNDDAVTDFDLSVPKLITPHCTRHGFICRGRALFHIFTYLKSFVNKKVHSDDYKQATEMEQMRFQRIVDVIGEALWKYAVIEKIDDSLSRTNEKQKFQLEPEELMPLVRAHIHFIERSSSDDDNGGGNGNGDRFSYTNLTRRKSTKKRRRATFSGGTRPKFGAFERSKVESNSMNSSVSVVQNCATENVDALREIRARNMVNRLTDRSIIPKMLGTPENLAIMTLALKNFDDVKYIIETFNLKNSELNRELHFVEQQQQVKQKLSAYCANYQIQDQYGKEETKPLATVQQIKAVAAKGFEVSKFISVIDNFSQTHKLMQTVEMKNLLSKHINSNPQYGFLQHFQEHNLNVVIITDLVLNLSLNRELTSNVLMVIKRQQNFMKTEALARSTTSHSITQETTNNNNKAMKTSKFSLDIGVLPFLENLCECLRLLQDKLTLSELLTDNYYSLKPQQLSLELQREDIFKLIFKKSYAQIAHLNDLQTHSSYFQHIQGKNNYYQRFITYIDHLTRLVKLRDQNLELHISELLKIDPCTVIGELLFEKDLTPLEIETNVAALNLNLVHVIALNICPEIGGRESSSTNNNNTTTERQKTILNYISQQNGLLSCILESIINGKSFDVEGEEKLSSKFLKRFLELPEIEQLAALYDGNCVIAALRSDSIDYERLGKLPKLQQIDILQLEIGNRAFASQHKNEIDRIVTELIQGDPRNIHLAEYVNNLQLRAQLIQENFTRMATTRLAKQLIESTLQHKDAVKQIPLDLRHQLEHTLVDITVYAKVSEVLRFETWPQAYDFGLKTPNVIFRKLLQQQLFHLCYEWCQIVKLIERFEHFKKAFLATLLEAFLQLNDDDEMNTYLLRILELFPEEECIGFLDENKDKFRCLLLLDYAIEFLMKQNQNVEERTKKRLMAYGNYQISLRVFQELTHFEREQFWHIFKYPLLIIEQLIMNSKLEILSKVLKSVRKSLNEFSKGIVCDYCFDKHGHIYDIHTKHTNTQKSHKAHFQIGVVDSSSNAHTAFMLLNFNLYQPDHQMTHECIDLLLRIYATKALDYHVTENYLSSSSSSERVSQSTDMQHSTDSLDFEFKMPKTAPTRNEWIKDEDATHCMCCRRVAFSMLMRKHHCRRCGRVICFACSSHRMLIPELYANVEVRVCNDCQRISFEEQERLAARDSCIDKATVATRHMTEYSKRQSHTSMFRWRLSGNITHDKLLREEFCYEHAPSVALCLSILEYHMGQKKCVDLLLYHCRKLEKLFVPNPEVDYELVAKMMNCLALAAKVRGGPAEIESIREHSEIIMSVVQNGCESLIPANNQSLRKLADALVQAENWSLALEVHLKCGFPTPGVMAAHGLACLRTGCFDTAREKLSYCMPKLTNENANALLHKFLLYPSDDEHGDQQAVDWYKNHDIPKIRRPQRGPPLLQEILKIITATAISTPQPETLQRASLIRNSNTSLASLLSRRKEAYTTIPVNEPALNVLTTLANLKRISKGDYGLPAAEGIENSSQRNEKNRCFEESFYYVLTYGSHTDVLQFLMHHQRLNAALRYLLVQKLDAELFIHNIYLACLRCGEVPNLIESIFRFDARLTIWQPVLIQTCRYLESHNLLNSLYQLQILLKDPVRASMTCVKFYTMNCENFEQLDANSDHLRNAHKHLQSELEFAQWDNSEQIKSATSFLANAFRGRRSSSRSASIGNIFSMQMDARTINTHINTILLQQEATKFLTKCERDPNNRKTELVTLKLLKEMRAESTKTLLPTLFDGSTAQIQICILILYCGKNIEEGFGLAYRIIQDYKLSPMKVFNATAKYLALNKRLNEVEQLLNCIISNNGTSSPDLDELLSVAINAAVNTHEPEIKAALDGLIKRIHSVEMRISMHIFIGQLKSAYLLAIKHEKINDIRKILRQAELTKQIHIKRLCERKLSMTTSTNSGNSQASD